MRLKASQIAALSWVLCATAVYAGSQGATLARPVPGTHTCASYYPREAILRGTTGEVLIHYDVEANGNLTHVFVLRSSGVPALDLAAVTCVSKGWRNTPATKDGVTIASPNHKAIIRFVLSENSIPQNVISGAIRIYVSLAILIVIACVAFGFWKDRHRGTLT